MIAVQVGSCLWSAGHVGAGAGHLSCHLLHQAVRSAPRPSLPVPSAPCNEGWCGTEVRDPSPVLQGPRVWAGTQKNRIQQRRCNQRHVRG